MASSSCGFFGGEEAAGLTSSWSNALVKSAISAIAVTGVEMGMAKAVRSNKLFKTSVLSGALSQAKTATWMVIDNTASLPLKDLRIHTAHASFFLLPSGGGEERRTRQTKGEQRQTHTHITHIIQASMAKPWVYSQVFYLQARAMYKKCLSPSFLEEPDVSGE